VISGIDWCASTNRIVTASHDRNAFVWNYEATPPTASAAPSGAAAASGTWKPQVVVLNINRAALDVKWSPDGEWRAEEKGKTTSLSLASPPLTPPPLALFPLPLLGPPQARSSPCRPVPRW
jgi:WD40 repeat protein